MFSRVFDLTENFWFPILLDESFSKRRKKFDCVLDFILACHKSSDEWFIGLDKIFSWKGCEIFSKFPAHVLMNWGQKVHTPKNRESREGFVKAQLERRYFYPPPKSPIFFMDFGHKMTFFSKKYIGFVCDVRETKTLANHKLLKTLTLKNISGIWKSMLWLK